MYPKILGIDAYVVMAAIGFAAAFLLAFFRRKTFNYKPLDIVSMLCVSIMGLTIGAKLLFIATELPAVIANDFSAEIVESRIINGGFVFYGGVIGASVCICILAGIMKRDRVEMMNYVIPCFSTFHCFGRIGCLLQGCCYGVESSAGGVYIAGATRVPVQLYEAIALAAITACMLLIEAYCRKKGSAYNLIPVYILLYAPTRFLLETLRGDELRGVASIVVNYATSDGGFIWSFDLSTSQLISLILLIAVGVWWIGKLMIKHYIKVTESNTSDDEPSIVGMCDGQLSIDEEVPETAYRGAEDSSEDSVEESAEESTVEPSDE